MNRATKVAIVLGGYAGAFLAASGATAIRVALTSGPDASASSGMYAGGDLMLFLAVFGAVALIPSGAALVFVRSRPWFSTLLTATAGAAALSGAGAIVAYLDAARPNPAGVLLGVFSLFAIVRLFGSPLVGCGLAFAALIAPTRGSRHALLTALAVEAAVFAYTGFHFFLAPQL